MTTFALIGIVAPKGHPMRSNYIDRAAFVNLDRTTTGAEIVKYLENEGVWMTALEKTMVGVIVEGTLEEVRAIL